MIVISAVITILDMFNIFWFAAESYTLLSFSTPWERDLIGESRIEESDIIKGLEVI